MELMEKQGYKQTEVGLIPEDWEIFEMSQILNGIADVDHYMPKTEKNGVPYVMTGDLKDKVSNIDFDNCKKISNSDYKKLSKKVKNIKGDIILARYATVGTVTNVDIDIDFIVSYSCVTIKPNFSKILSAILYYYFKSNIFKLEVSNKVNANIQDNVGIGDLVKMKVPLPPTINEQKAIATALSDVDELISNLDKLITKKKSLKQGAIQQLLTPKENWTLTSLIELAENKKSNFDDGDWIESEFIIESGIRLIQTGNIGIGKFIEKGSKKYISEESFFKLRCKEVIKGDLLICRLAEPAGRACVMPNIGESKVITSVDVSIFRGDDKIVNREFLSQYFTTGKWFNQLLERVGGTTHKRISRGALGKIEFFLPNIEEQKTIAQILADMDLELDQLETKKAKYLNIKQGMMQELLTGKTRLV